jgi:hypothetical protein
MSQILPEVLDYRDLVGKLARIDSEWESLKGLLTFRSPHTDKEPVKSPTANHSQTNMDSKVVGFAKSSAQVKPRTECQRYPGAVTLTPGELGALGDGTLMLRFVKVERYIHKLTVLVGAFMALSLVLFAILIFQGLKDNKVNRSAFPQPKEIAAPANPVSPEAKVSGNDSPAPSVPPLASNSQAAPATSGPAENIVNSSETETSTAIAAPAPKFVGSITSNKIHYPDCKWAKTIKPERLITFPSIAAARQQGYIPCPVCRPHESEETH